MIRILSLILGLFLSFSIQPLHGQINSFEHIHIGTKWIYETVEYDIPVIRYDSKTFVISDTSTFNGKPVFVVENNLDNRKEYIWLDGDSLYYWDADLQDFQLNYVLDTISSYESDWSGQCHTDEGTATITLDSLSTLIFDDDNILVQHVSIADNGTTEQDWIKKIYSGIGQASGGLKLQLGWGLCDLRFNETQLRCFESNLGSYNFVGYSCDSMWVDLAYATTELNEDDMLVFPNPGLNDLTFHVKGFDAEQLRVDLVDAIGVIRFSKQDLTSSISIPDLPAGQYFYRIFNGVQLLGVGVWVKQ